MNPTYLINPRENNAGTPSRLRFDITSYSQDQVGNYSDVNWRVTFTKAGESGSTAYFYGGALWVDGEQVWYRNTSVSWESLYEGYVFATGTKRITHNSDGSRQFGVILKQLFYLTYSSTRWGGDQWYSGDTSATEVGSMTVTANTIPRYPLLSLGSVSRQLNKLTVGVSNTRPGTITSWEVRKVSDNSLVTSGTSATVSFDLTSLTPNTNYNGVYKVRAYANGGWGDYLTLDIGTTNALPTFSVTSFDVGGKPKITLSNMTNVDEYEVKLRDGTTVVKTVGDLTSNNYEIELSSGELNTILNNHPNDITIQLNYLVTITSNSSTYSLNNPNGNMVIPDALYKPTFTISMIAYADQNPTATNLTGSNQKIIKGVSNVKFTIQPMTANGGATPVNYQVNSGSIFNSGNHTGSAIEILLNAVDAGTATIIATDSRGKTTIVPLNYAQFVDYASPSIETLNARRNGGVTANVIFDIIGLFNNWSGLSASNNIQSIQYRYKETGTSTWSSYITLTGITYTDNTYNLIGVISTGDLFNITKGYYLDIKITDKLSSKSQQTSITSGQPFVWKDLLNKLFGIGKKPVQALDVAGDINTDGNFRKNGAVWNPTFNKLDCYPVNSVYIETTDTNPATLFGGTWVRLISKYLYAMSGAAMTQSTSSGANTQSTAITEAQLPSHTHSPIAHNHGQDAHSHGIAGSTGGPDWTAPYAALSGSTGQDTGVNASYRWSPVTRTAQPGIWNGLAYVNSTGSGQGHTHDVSYVALGVWYRSA